MKKKKWYLAVVALCLVGGICGVAVWQYNKEPSYEIATISASYAFDHDDYTYYLRDVDYAFVGKITDTVGTDYEDKDVIDGKEVSTPYTKYSVAVSKSIKGDIQTGQDVQVKKMGGISEDKKEYYLCEEDTIPEEGEYYLFMAYAQENGELLIAGQNSSIATNKKNTTKIGKKIESFLTKAQKQGDTPREHYEIKKNGKGL